MEISSNDITHDSDISGNTSAECFEYDNEETYQVNPSQSISYEYKSQNWSLPLYNSVSSYSTDPSEIHVKEGTEIMQTAIKLYLNERMGKILMRSPYQDGSFMTLSSQLKATSHSKKSFSMDRPKVLERLFQNSMTGQKLFIIKNIVNERFDKIIREPGLKLIEEKDAGRATSFSRLDQIERDFAKDILELNNKYNFPCPNLAKTSAHTIHGKLIQNLQMADLDISVNTHGSIITSLYESLKPTTNDHNSTGTNSMFDSQSSSQMYVTPAESKNPTSVIPKDTVLTIDHLYIQTALDKNLVRLIG